MAAYMISLLNNRNADWFEGYVVNVPRIIRKYGGDYVAFSTNVKKLEGDVPAPQQVAIFTFPSVKAIEDFMSCEEYRPWSALRKANARAELFVFEGDEALMQQARKYWAAGAD